MAGVELLMVILSEVGLKQIRPADTRLDTELLMVILSEVGLKLSLVADNSSLSIIF